MHDQDSQLVTLDDNGDLTTDTERIAAGTDNHHASVLRLVRDNLDDLNEFGTVGFEIRPRPAGQHGGGDRQVAILNEEQATLLLTYMRNNAVVREFKKRLVRAFYAMRRGAPAQLPSTRELAQMVIAAEDAREKAEAQLEVEQRHRKAIEGGDGIDPTTFGKKYFSDVRKSDFEDHLYDHGYLINQRLTRQCSDGKRRDGYDHRKPTAKGRRFFYTHDNGTYNGRRRFVARVRPQMEIELRDALIAEGLPANEHSTGLVLISNDEIRELGA